MGWYLLMWGMFTLFMLIGTVNYPRVKQFVFASLTVLFFLLAARDFTGSTLIGTIAGFEGIICGASAIYLAMATVINEQFVHRDAHRRSQESRRRSAQSRSLSTR